VVERHAEYHNGTNTSELLFRYLLRTGDVCLGRLDYHADEREFRSSAHAFEANNRERHLTAAAASAKAKADAETARFFGPTTSSSSSGGGAYARVDSFSVVDPHPTRQPALKPGGGLLEARPRRRARHHRSHGGGASHCERGAHRGERPHHSGGGGGWGGLV